jgi:hypothetical protein
MCKYAASSDRNYSVYPSPYKFERLLAVFRDSLVLHYVHPGFVKEGGTVKQVRKETVGSFGRPKGG